MLLLFSQSCLTFWDHMNYSLPASLCPWDFPSKSTGICCHSLLQDICLNPGTEPIYPALADRLLTIAPSGKTCCKRYSVKMYTLKREMKLAIGSLHQCRSRMPLSNLISSLAFHQMEESTLLWRNVIT